MTGPRERPPIVVGVDGSDTAMAALRWALQRAVQIGAVVEVVHAWTDIQPPTLIAREVWVALSLLNHPPEVRNRYQRGLAADVLIARSGDAQLLVLGAGSRFHRVADRFGPVTVACRREASCPVVVVDEFNRQPLEEARAHAALPSPRRECETSGGADRFVPVSPPPTAAPSADTRPVRTAPQHTT